MKTNHLHSVATLRSLAAALLLAVTTFAGLPQPAQAFGFDDLEKVEKVERGERKVREARAEAARREEEIRRQAQRPARSSGSSGSGGAGWVSVEAECVTGRLCEVTNLTISGGPGRFEPSYTNAGSGSIYPGFSGGLAGQYSYSYSIQTGGQRCVASGSFSANGSARNIKVNHYPDCRLSNVHQF